MRPCRRPLHAVPDGLSVWETMRFRLRRDGRASVSEGGRGVPQSMTLPHFRRPLFLRLRTPLFENG